MHVAMFQAQFSSLGQQAELCLVSLKIPAEATVLPLGGAFSINHKHQPAGLSDMIVGISSDHKVLAGDEARPVVRF